MKRLNKASTASTAAAQQPVPQAAPTTAPHALDVSELPTFAFGSRNVVWWGTITFMTIEGTAFAVMIATYLYYRTRISAWPLGVPDPDLLVGSLITGLFLLSIVPNQWVKRAARRQDLRASRIALLACDLFAAAIIGFRVFEFGAFHCRWDTNVYGSVVWTLLGLHTTHLVTDFADSLVLTALLFIGPVDASRFGDVADNSLYWYFVVFSWLPIYALLYFAPRLL